MDTGRLCLALTLGGFAAAASAATVATPIFTPGGGTYNAAQTVTIADATAGAKIYYTTNGTTPTTRSTVYAGPIVVSSTKRLKAIATASGYTSSAVATATYTLVTATPAFSPAAGTYSTAQTVTLSGATPGAKIYYTTNGTTPTTASTLYSTPIPVTATTTIMAIAAATGFTTSTVSSANYTITPPAATPTITPSGGTYSTAQLVTITDTTPGATIYFTVDGTAPTTSSSPYSGPITVSTPRTVQAMATAPGYSASAAATGVFAIVPVVTALSIQAPSAVVDAGATLQLAAQGNYSDGSSRDLTSEAAWISSDPSVASLSATGLVSGLRGGAVVVTASSPPFTASVTISVVSPALTYCYDVAGNMTARLTCATSAPCEARCP